MRRWLQTVAAAKNNWVEGNMIRRFFENLEEALISLLLVTLTLLVFMEVVLRFGFGVGLVWIQEVTLHVAAWFVLLGASYGIRVGAHIQVDVLVSKLAPTARRFISLIALVAAVLYCVLFFYGSWIYLAKLKSIGIEMEDVAFPKWIAHAGLVVGILLISLRVLVLLWLTFKGQANGFQSANEAEEILEEYDAS